MTYVVCKCRPGADVRSVVRKLQERIPEDDVLTTREFRDRHLQELGNEDGSRSAAALPVDSGGAGGVSDGDPDVLYLDDSETSAVRIAEGHRGGNRRACIHPPLSSGESCSCSARPLAAACLWPVLVALRSTTIAVLITPKLVLGGCGALLFSSMVGACSRSGEWSRPIRARLSAREALAQRLSGKPSTTTFRFPAFRIAAQRLPTARRTRKPARMDS